MRHVDHVGKREWVKQVKQQFCEIRGRAPFLSPVDRFTCRELLDTFGYGARIFHGEPQGSAERDLLQLLADFGREEVIMAVQSCLKELQGQVNLAYHPIVQDFSHWVGELGLPGPDKVQVTELLGSRP